MAVLFLNTTAGLALISDAKAMAATMGGGTAVLASAFVVILALADVSGRLFWPTLSDSFGQARVFLAMFVLQTVAFVLLPLAGTGRFVVFALLSSLVLTCYGGGYAAMPALVGAYYGPRDVATIYGGMITASGIAGLGAPVLLARFADTTGSYDLALYVIAALMLVGTAIMVAMRPPGAPRS